MVDHPADRFVDQARLLDSRVTRCNLAKYGPDEWHLGEVGDREQPGTQPVVDIMVVVGDVVGERGDLRLGPREGIEGERMAAVILGDRRWQWPVDAGAAQRAVVLDRAFERFPGQVEAVELGVTALQP